MEQKGYPSMQASEFHSQHQPQNNPPPYDMHNQHQAQPQMAPGFIYSQTTTPQMHTIMEQPSEFCLFQMNYLLSESISISD